MEKGQLNKTKVVGVVPAE